MTFFRMATLFNLLQMSHDSRVLVLFLYEGGLIASCALKAKSLKGWNGFF